MKAAAGNDLSFQVIAVRSTAQSPYICLQREPHPTQMCSFVPVGACTCGHDHACFGLVMLERACLG